MARKITTININGKPYTIGQDKIKNKLKLNVKEKYILTKIEIQNQ